MPNPFSAGVVVYFRTLDQTNTLARSIHPEGRDIELAFDAAHRDDYVIVDEEGKVLGIYPREWVACILPLQTTGPAHATDQQTRHHNPTETETGDTQGFPGRAKRFDS